MSDPGYQNLCFVIMPFGTREVADRKYDFDAIYHHVFEIAASMVDVPGGGRLIPKRADTPNTPGIITQEMFRDILYARIVLCDITGLNPNVFYELGVRHALRPTATVVFKEVHSTIPFDVRDLRIFDYDIDGIAGQGAAIQKIRTTLEESLKANILASPVVAALRDDIEWPTFDPASQTRHKLRSWVETQREQAAVDAYRQEAERAVQRGDLAAGEASLRGAQSLARDNLGVNMQLVQLLRDRGDFRNAELLLRTVTESYPTYAPAWRELGIAEHKVKKATEAVRSLQRAVSLNPHDVDGWCSLGGALKTLGQVGEAQDAYQKALALNPHDPYPLLNYTTMYALNNNQLPDPRQLTDAIGKATATCLAEIAAGKRLPWCHFDLAQFAFLQGNMSEFRAQATSGAKAATARWQAETAIKTYVLLQDTVAVRDAAKEATQYLTEEASKYLPGP